MIGDPILAREGSSSYEFTVYGGLRYVRGNPTPYFTLTYWKGGENGEGGAGHEEIERRFPGRFTDLAALHMSDPDGTPWGAEGNGWYWLAGALGGAGERYHGGNRETYGKDPDCLGIFARHCRITIEEAAAIRDDVLAEATRPEDIEWGEWESNTKEPDWKKGRSRWAVLMERMRPRWKAEAEACIAHHNLIVFGH